MPEIEPRLLLASASPRRRQLITLLGLPIINCVSPLDEEAAEARYQGPNDGLGLWLAEKKARAALTLPEATGRIIIASDTTVLLEESSLGKPRDASHARELLLALRGRWHRVVTGVAVACHKPDGTERLLSARQVTPVLMRPYSEAEIDAYIATGDPLDKAGAYGVQSSSFQPTAQILGCYLNVVGLPLCTLANLLEAFSINLPTNSHTSRICPWSEKCTTQQENML